MPRASRVERRPLLGSPKKLVRHCSSETGADVILKATKVKGVYSDDPVRDPAATFCPRITYLDILTRGLKVMDTTALSLCMDNGLPIYVFGLDDEENIQRVARGERVGTVISTPGRTR